MKIRNGFVSNSSCSSFVLKTSGLSDLQRRFVLDYFDHAKLIMEKSEEDFGCLDDGWYVYEEGDYIHGSTVCDNFDFEAWMKYLGIDVEDENIVKFRSS